MPTVYLASPLGFSPEWKTYRQKVVTHLEFIGCIALDPWDLSFHGLIEDAQKIRDLPSRITAFEQISVVVGQENEKMIRSADVVLGVLDGMEPDSGTVSEIGFAAGIGKKCSGLRTDIRNAGEFDGIPINLQVLHWIRRSGGELFRKIEEIRF